MRIYEHTLSRCTRVDIDLKDIQASFGVPVPMGSIVSQVHVQIITEANIAIKADVGTTKDTKAFINQIDLSKDKHSFSSVMTMMDQDDIIVLTLEQSKRDQVKTGHVRLFVTYFTPTYQLAEF